MICKIYPLDVLEFLEEAKEQYGKHFARIIIADPPYNIGKADWDFISNYSEWCGKWIGSSLDLLADNGSYYIFHNHFRSLRDIDFWIEQNTSLRYNRLLIWNKFFDKCSNHDYLTTHLKIKSLNNYQRMKEYILFYTKNNTHKLKDKREELGLSQIEISSELRSKNDNLTGWYSNIENDKNYPTRETIIPIKKHLGIDYDDLVPYFKSIHDEKKKLFNNSVWNYDISKKYSHITPKPIPLIKNLLIHSSKQGDMVVNLFSGSGNIEIACLESKRNVLGCEINKKYLALANTRLNLLRHVTNDSKTTN